ncbi:MAG: zinc ribbon domain-containing protein [Bacilli bacterium]|nr:zinc ribbon domain-containing protein [Bacilli bacterium]
MKCLKCGTENAEGSLFCIKCGANLKDTENVTQEAQASIENNQNESVQEAVIPVQVAPVQEAAPVQAAAPVAQQPVVNTQQTQTSVNTSPLNYLMFIIAIILKPFKSFKDEESKLTNPKTSLIFTLIITGAMTVINLITTVFNAVHVKSFLGETSWVWDNLKNIKWLEVIGKNFLIYVGVIFAITVVFYLGGLVAKKQVNFIKTLSITTTSVIPAVICSFILAPIGGLIWSYLSVFFSITGIVYSLTIFTTLINEELKLTEDMKVYFFTACFAILCCGAYFAVMKFIESYLTSSLTSSFGSLFSSYLG